MKIFENNTAANGDTNLAFIPIVKAKRDGKYIVAVQEKGTKIPLFIVQGYFYFLALAEHLEKDQPVYCLDFSPHKKIEDIAAHYIKEIKTVQANGPYIIGGFCFMGNIAIEIAAQLLQQGEKVSVVLLFESYAPTARLSKTSVKYLKHKTAFYKTELKGLSIVKIATYFYTACKNKLRTTLAGEQSFSKKYPGKVILFRAKVQTLAMKETVDSGWLPYVTGGLEIYDIDADHVTFFREPAITQLAEHLSVIFERENKEAL